MFIGVPLGGRRSSRVRISDKANDESVNQTDMWDRRWSDWLVESGGILLEHKGTKRHGFLRV